MEKVLFVGGRRGLGGQVLTQWQTRFPDHSLAASSRQKFESPGVQTRLCDVSKKEDCEKLLQFITDWQPQRVFYFAGGGPYGVFGNKSWKDHEWALQVSLWAPMQIVHKSLNTASVQQVVVVGSSIAEDQPDKNAASYSAAKHGLKGFISTLNAEKPPKDVRLFSPGYMATDMLPPPARENKSVAEPSDVAIWFIDWVLDKGASWHGRNPTD